MVLWKSPLVNFPQWIPPAQIPPNLTLPLTLTLTQVGIQQERIDQRGNFRTPVQIAESLWIICMKKKLIHIKQKRNELIY